MDILFVPLLRLCILILSLYNFVIFAYIIVSLLEQFGIINRYNQVVFFVHSILFRLSEPVLSRIRMFMPKLEGIDLSPLVVMLAIYFLKDMLLTLLLRFPA